MSDAHFKDLLSSQELNFMLDEEPDIGDFVNGSMGILEDETLPEQYNEVPSNEYFPGQFEFETYIDPHATKNWMYSSLLNKVFIISHSSFPIDFKWNAPSDKISLFVRAMPLYSLAQDANKPVTRCIQHAHVTETSNKGFSHLARMHIMRCMNDQAQYEGGATRHFSVVVPLGLPQAGNDTFRQMFVFVCKNSCATGMNRRPIEVIFTLEDRAGTIYGRTKVSVRICSCPKRDKEKEEAEHLKTRDGSAPQHGKKRKLVTKKVASSFNEASDGGSYPVNISVIGKKNQKAVIKYAQDLMASEMVRHKIDEPFKTCYNEIGNFLKNHE